LNFYRFSQSALTRRHKRTALRGGVYCTYTPLLQHASLSFSLRTDAYICGRARARQKCEHVHKYSHIEPAVAWPLFIVALISISMKAGIPCTENRRRIAVLLYLNGRTRECRKYSISSRQISKGPFFAPRRTDQEKRSSFVRRNENEATLGNENFYTSIIRAENHSRSTIFLFIESIFLHESMNHEILRRLSK
jgi:hypothetical protein